MTTSRLFRSFVLAALLALSFFAAARAAEETTTIAFSDPEKPGTLKINLASGELRIQGADTKEIAVRSEARATGRPVRKDGLRVLSSASSYSLAEKDNVVTLNGTDGFSRGADFQLTVPRGTSVVVRSSFGGDVQCSGIEGDIEIHSLNGEVTLNDVTGGAVVETTNGEIHASIRTLAVNRPLSFTSMNGEVVLRVPADTKANVRLRTQNGSVLTDFDDTALITKTENTPRPGRNRGGRLLPPEAAEAIRNAARVAAEVSREAAEAAREGLEAAREAAGRARNDDAADGPGVPVPPLPPTPPLAPVPPPPLPTITGGKLVTGTLNGGGPEINVATLNGDVTLRKYQPGR